MKSLIKLTILSGITLLLSWGCTASDSSTNKVEESVPVEVMKVKRGDIIQSISYTGDINAEFEVNVFSKVPDRIEKFYVDEGDYVRKGDLLASILASTIEQGVKQAEAARIAARVQETNLRLEYERAQRLHKEDAMSQQQYDAIKTQYEAARAQVEQAEASVKSAASLLKDAQITAPISGIIGKRYFEDGDMAVPSMPLLRIVQMDRIKIDFNATEQDLGKLALGQEAAVKVRAYPDTVFYGKVSKISPVLDPMTRMAEIEVMVDNKQKLLKPGMFANVDVTTSVLKDVLVIPRHASIESTTMEKINGEDQVIKNYYVYTVDSSRAHQRKLDVSYVNHVSMAVVSGVNVGELLVIAGQNNLRDSMLVTTVQNKGEDQ